MIFSYFARLLLAKNRAHRNFKTVPATGNTQTLRRLNAPCHQWIRGETRGDFIRVGAEIEHATHSFDDEEQPARFGK